MSFKSVLLDIEHVAGIGATEAQAVAPFVSAVYPPAGAAVSVISSLVIAAEKAFPDTAAANHDKQQSVLSGINTALPLLQAGLQMSGVKFDVTPQLETVITKTVNDVVALLNDMAAIKAAIEGVPIVAAPVAPAV